MKILIIQLWRMGDILVTTPVISYLRQVFPEAQIDFLATPCGQNILESNPHLSHLKIYDRQQGLQELRHIRQEKYDVVLDFLNNPRSGLITGLSGARWRVGFSRSIRRLFYNVLNDPTDTTDYNAKRKLRLTQRFLDVAFKKNIPPTNYLPEIYLTEGDTTFANQWAERESLRETPFAVLVPVARLPIRSWGIENYTALALKLLKKKMRVYVSCGPGEEPGVEPLLQECKGQVTCLPRGTFRETGAIFKRAQFIVCNDSGAMHLAVAVNAPTITLYGPSVPRNWNPSYDPELKTQHTHIPLRQESLPCLECLKRECPIGHLCMKELTSDRVMEVVGREGWFPQQHNFFKKIC